MKTAIWLYLFMFIAFFDLHAQFPILSPFAISLGATPSFIGLIMGMYSLTHIPGNILAGYGVDRYGSKYFIIFSLIIAGVLLVIQSSVTNPWQLLTIRSISGFILAFLSPACLSLLAKIAKDQIHQGKLMAGNGLVHTLASIVSPAAGALLVAKVGYTVAFSLLGWVLIITGIMAFWGIQNIKTTNIQNTTKHSQPLTTIDDHKIPWLFYILPLALSCSQGILFFELPLIPLSRNSIMASGLLFSIVSLGALCTLSLLFLNRISPFLRTVSGCLLLAMIFFDMALHQLFPLTISLFIIGMAKGIIYPAMATYLTHMSSASKYGRIFAVLSIAMSLGAFIGPVIAGQIRDVLSPYFIAFIFLFIALSMLPYPKRFSILTSRKT
ncbi:MFS transporter [Chengkuizengella axinellae]|uniref:MFS transporter n=1 Tax=Chengkuizengella axinellae TaxID=3064388 RepID=A0ABT9IT58_9BACL|nr:MFS transporter [Chengkuizengella sp. 2205SS18-9]MDP5272545.1 MFS transporter [Chengkuizengella sp. 2205SS18-9]